MGDMRDDADLDIHIDDGAPRVIRVTGDVDGETSGLLWAAVEKVLASGASELAFDLRQVGFMDSSGLAVLVRASKVAEVQVRGTSLAVRILLDATGLDHFIGREP
jgi:stage II sporulation protein AA (anti-sigma F factor antagonist)